MIQDVGSSSLPRCASGSEPPRRGSDTNGVVAVGLTPTRASTQKLYVLARMDLDVGLRTAQVGHALIGWVLQHGPPPDNLVVLQVPDEDTLRRHWAAVQILGHRYEAFMEPDLDDQLTAIAMGPEAHKWLSSLPLLR